MVIERSIEAELIRWKDSENRKPLEFDELIDKKKLHDEFIMLRFRTSDGINLEEYYHTFGENFKAKHKKVTDSLVNNNFARFEDGHFKLSFKGLLICDEISPKFVF